MKTTPKALKGLYTALGGSSPIADESKTVDVLNAISTKIGGDGGATRVPDAIDNIAAKADDLVIPTGTIAITENGENIDVAQYEKATVNVSGGGSSDFSTAEVTLDLTVPSGVTISATGLYGVSVSYPDENHGYGSEFIPSNNNKVTILLYQGHAHVYAAVIQVSNEDPYLLEGQDATLTGNATYDSDTGAIDITGDCTISGTPVQSNG